VVWQPRDDADAIVESCLATVGMDSANTRCPVVVFKAFGVTRAPLPPGEIEGSFSLDNACASYCMIGPDAVVRWRACHECGHLMLHLVGRRLPHDESLASRCGRALAISRGYMLALLACHRDHEITGYFASWLPEEQTDRRIWEVRRSVIRLVG